MKVNNCFAFLVMMLGCSFAQVTPVDTIANCNYPLIAQADSLPVDTYDTIYKELLTTDSTDYLWLRLAYLKSNYCTGWGVNSVWKDSLYAAINRKKFTEGKPYLDSLLRIISLSFRCRFGLPHTILLRKTRCSLKNISSITGA